MEITWYGLSCFRIREGGVTVMCDPYDKTVGMLLPKVRADIVTVSHERSGHNAVDRVTGEPKILRGPGEYEIKNVFVTGATTYHRRTQDEPSERNVIFFMEFGGLTVGHLGDLGEIPAQSEIEELNVGEVDVLMVPVGGGETLDPTPCRRGDRHIRAAAGCAHALCPTRIDRRLGGGVGAGRTVHARVGRVGPGGAGCAEGDEEQLAGRDGGCPAQFCAINAIVVLIEKPGCSLHPGSFYLWLLWSSTRLVQFVRFVGHQAEVVGADF